jgi:hypothetical protein
MCLVGEQDGVFPDAMEAFSMNTAQYWRWQATSCWPPYQSSSYDLHDTRRISATASVYDRWHVAGLHQTCHALRVCTANFITMYPQSSMFQQTCSVPAFSTHSSYLIIFLPIPTPYPLSPNAYSPLINASTKFQSKFLLSNVGCGSKLYPMSAALAAGSTFSPSGFP